MPDVGVSQVLAQLPDVGVSPAVLTPARVGVSQGYQLDRSASGVSATITGLGSPSYDAWRRRTTDYPIL